MRLNRFIAAAGIASRRRADDLIAAGGVTVNGKLCTDFHYQPSPTDHVKVKGKLLRPPTAYLYLALHKPSGFVCTRHDPKATDTIYDLLPAKFSSLFYVGRLDAQTEGLLLLTSDGDFAEQLTHPRFKVEKEYVAVLDKPIATDMITRLRRGVVLDGKRARMKEVEQTSSDELRVVLDQGMNRQIRRMVARCGAEVKRLRRVRIANITLDDLDPGKWRPLRATELRQRTR